jgi:hypothetical protein
LVFSRIANTLIQEADNREKLYNAFRAVLRFFPELANAIRLTGEHVANAEGVSLLPTYNVGLKINSDVKEADTDHSERDNLILIKDKFKFDTKVFEKATDLVREGDYFVEIIDVSKTTVEMDTDKQSPTNGNFKLLTESISKLNNDEHDKFLTESAISCIAKKIIYSGYDSETELLIENTKIGLLAEAQKESVGNTITENSISGIILRKHKPEFVCVLTINAEVFGYVIVSSEANIENKDDITNMFTNLTADKTRNNNRKTKSELAVDFSKRMSKMILNGLDFTDAKNAKLINKIISTNIEIKKMIYNNLLTENSTAIRFVAPENMVHYKVPSVVEIDNTYGESAMYSMLPDIKDYIKLKKTLTNYLLIRSVEKERITVSVDRW